MSQAAIHILPITSIKIPENRQRREFNPDQLMELSNSIEANGLLHPVVVRVAPDGGFFLVAGERRLRAIQDVWGLGGTLRFAGADIPEGSIPATDLGELSYLEAMEAELDENIRRTDLTLQERIAAVAKLAELRTAQRAEQGLPPPTAADIAEEVRGSSEGRNQADTRKELILAKHLDNPVVREAKTLKEAWKGLQREEIRKKNEQRTLEVGKVAKDERHSVLNLDCLEWIKAAPEESFDVILTDPPYGMSADEFGDSGGIRSNVVAHAYKDDYEGFHALMSVLCPESFRIAKPQAHLYCFCDIDRFHELRDFFELAGWQVHRTPLIFVKPGGIRAPWPDGGPQRKYELILYARKGDRPVNFMAGDVLTFPADANLGHSAQKPVGLYHELLRRSARPGDSVLDPFAGTGPIIPAADALKCRATAIERDPVAYGIATKRLEDLGNA